jgi:hypothetical protein
MTNAARGHASDRDANLGGGGRIVGPLRNVFQEGGINVALIRNQKDLGAGVLYVAFGAVGFFIARDYGMGQASRMGPGYFPTVLSTLLMTFGAAAIIRSFFSKEPGNLEGFAWKQALLVCGATALFGALLIPAGLIIALIALCLVSAAGSHYFKFEWRAVGALILLVVFCGLVFVKGLGVPMPLFGTWFGG